LALNLWGLGSALIAGCERLDVLAFAETGDKATLTVNVGGGFVTVSFSKRASCCGSDVLIVLVAMLPVVLCDCEFCFDAGPFLTAG
jgi:hypothetical protein